MKGDGKGQKTKYEWGNPDEDGDANAIGDELEEEEKEKADFGLSGALAKDSVTGNTYNGVVIKFVEPVDARVPTKRWRLYVFKGNAPDPIETQYIHRQSAYLVGREKKVCDIRLMHPSVSKQNSVIQFRMREVGVDDRGGPVREILPYVMDLDSTNGTHVNGERIEPQRYIELREQDTVRFGNSSRDYVLLHDKSSTE